MKEKEDYSIKWSIARETIHLGYDYDNYNEPTQWDFISQISDEYLNDLYYYCALQKYTKNPISEYQNLSWNDLSELIKIECNYRKIEL